MDALREQFEAYFADSRRGKGAARAPTFARLTDGTYADDPTQRHWWTWQNALRAALAAPQPAGWVSVPAEPTEAMCNAGRNWAILPHRCYRAMIAAAPAPTEPQR